MSAQDHDIFFGPDDSELSDLSSNEMMEPNAEENKEVWELGAEDWANLDDEGWYTQLQLSRKRSGTLLSNLSDKEDHKRHKPSDAGPSTTIASGSIPTASTSILAASGTSESKPSKLVYTARPKRGFAVPKAAFDPWNTK
ncbi:hypothetical protein B0H13DRAFT_1891300 [Mycena leptocephala]|nr:hypothetical protein B0H13DRAFT_1891300 [Mycena leptocephala]